MEHDLLDILLLGDTGSKVAIMKDMSTSWPVKTITNSVEDLVKELEVNWILYQDSNDIWDAWNKDQGFLMLNLRGEVKEAIEEFIKKLQEKNIPGGKLC